MKKWDVGIQDCADYYDIEAETEEEAIEIALEWFSERKPYIIAKEVEED